jgi:chloramphenicol 3-O-phosphotransferase
MDPGAAPVPGQLVLVDGPPGAGKSAVAGIVAAAARRPTVHLHTDSLYVWIRSGFVPPYLPQAQAQNEVVATVMTEAACAYAQGGYDVIVDGIIGPWLLPTFQTACQRARLGLRYVVLRPSLEVALVRAAGRAGGQLTDPGPVTGLYRAFGDLGELERHVVDSGGQTPEQTAAELVAALDGGRFALRTVRSAGPGTSELPGCSVQEACDNNLSSRLVARGALTSGDMPCSWRFVPHMAAGGRAGPAGPDRNDVKTSRLLPGHLQERLHSWPL